MIKIRNTKDNNTTRTSARYLPSTSALFDFLDDFFRLSADRFDRLFGRSDFMGFSMQTNADIDIKEDERNLYLDIALPGISKENIKLEVGEGYVKFEAGSQEQQGEDEGNTKCHYSSIVRYYQGIIQLPVEIDAGNVEAKYDNGILHVKLSKAQKQTTTKISIQ